jgi:asparagine synthase (glutamine-hydrolysing)
MCGIAGFITANSNSPSDTVIRRMTSAITHRGPDDAGFHESAPAFLGQRRLSIVDLAGGHQPICNEDRSLSIVYNGEVFNHAAIRPELEAAGHSYTTRSDTETLLHAWEEWGPASFERFRGMFAYLIWDERKRRLVAVRDRLGIKPFYYFRDGSLFAFASEIKALLAHPAIRAVPNEALLSEYLAFGYTSGEETLFQGIRKLPPGHWLTYSAETGQLTIEQYWDVPDTPPDEVPSEADWIATVRGGLEETVRLRLMADVPLGVFLSGGVDSSAITALMQRMVPGRVRTFSVGYQEQQFSELAWARQVAEKLNTEHQEVVVSRDEFFLALPLLIFQEDEPITWPSSVPLYFVSRLAAQSVKVVLTGEGSDELFGRYERYRWTQMNLAAGRWYQILPTPLRRWMAEFLSTSSLIRADLRRKLSHTFLGREGSIESLLLDNFLSAFSPSQQRSLLRGDPGDIYGNYLKFWNARPDRSTLARMLYADQKTYLVQLLMKQDRMSMAASIESRVPFLDHHFLAMAMRIPDRFKIRGGEQKYIFKKSVEDLLPKDIVYRRKMGFPTPLKQWLREPALAGQLDALASPNSFIARWTDTAEVSRIITAHRVGQIDTTDRIWRLLNLELWGRRFFVSAAPLESVTAELIAIAR